MCAVRPRIDQPPSWRGSSAVLEDMCAFVAVLDTAFRPTCALVIVCMLDTLLLSVGPMLLSSILLRNRNPLLPQSGKVNVSITHHYKYTWLCVKLSFSYQTHAHSSHPSIHPSSHTSKSLEKLTKGIVSYHPPLLLPCISGHFAQRRLRRIAAKNDPLKKDTQNAFRYASRKE